MTNTKANFEKRGETPATTPHLQLHALITYNRGQHFVGNSELFPFDVVVFGMLHLAGNSFIVRCHVTMN